MFAGRNLFGILDFIVANILLPVNALLLAIFAGWALSRKIVKEQLGFEVGSTEYLIWNICTKYIAPVAISIIVYQLIFGDPVDQFNRLITWMFG